MFSRTFCVWLAAGYVTGVMPWCLVALILKYSYIPYGVSRYVTVSLGAVVLVRAWLGPEWVIKVAYSVGWLLTMNILRRDDIGNAFIAGGPPLPLAPPPPAPPSGYFNSSPAKKTASSSIQSKRLLFYFAAMYSLQRGCGIINRCVNKLHAVNKARNSRPRFPLPSFDLLYLVRSTNPQLICTWLSASTMCDPPLHPRAPPPPPPRPPLPSFLPYAPSSFSQFDVSDVLYIS